MDTISKIYLRLAADQPIAIDAPKGTTILGAREQGDRVAVWARGPEHSDEVDRYQFHLLATEDAIPEQLQLQYAGTAVMSPTSEIHVFYRRLDG